MPTNVPVAALPKGKKASVIGLAGLLVGLIAGAAFDRLSVGASVNPLSGQRGGYDEGYRAAMQKVSDAGLLPAAPTESTTIAGTVTAATSGSLKIEADNRSFDPLGLKSLPKTRTVTITASTTLVLIEQLMPQEFDAARTAYEASLSKFREKPDDQSPPPPPPNQFKETPITAADIRTGDNVTVEAAADILASSSIEAVRVTVTRPVPEAPASVEESTPETP